ncbi:hypothetical protein L1887_61078 [Cichorium endivia]|nr:hypothetical protein L1887_61078 [Cichorium endivia]
MHRCIFITLCRTRHCRLAPCWSRHERYLLVSNIVDCRNAHRDPSVPVNHTRVPHRFCSTDSTVADARRDPSRAFTHATSSASSAFASNQLSRYPFATNARHRLVPALIDARRIPSESSAQLVPQSILQLSRLDTLHLV